MKRIWIILSLSVSFFVAADAPVFAQEQPADTLTAVIGGMELGEAVSIPDEAEDLDSLWVKANTAYSNSDYAKAVDYYTAIVEQGKHSSKLYYNLGNSWYKQNRLGKAILNYNKALLLDPGDEDTRYNLAMANARIVDKIDSVPEFFFKTWMRDLAMFFGSNSWAVLGLIFLAMALGGVILWLLADTLAFRKLGFYGGIFCLILFLTSTVFANFQRKRILYDREAIVMNLVAPVKSSPGSGSKDLFVLHEGTKVKVLERLDGWAEILLSDGNKGWVLESAIETIGF